MQIYYFYRYKIHTGRFTISIGTKYTQVSYRAWYQLVVCFVPVSARPPLYFPPVSTRPTVYFPPLLAKLPVIFVLFQPSFLFIFLLFQPSLLVIFLLFQPSLLLNFLLFQPSLLFARCLSVIFSIITVIAVSGKFELFTFQIFESLFILLFRPVWADLTIISGARGSIIDHLRARKKMLPPPHKN